jgi:hypothetical protein
MVCSYGNGAGDSLKRKASAQALLPTDLPALIVNMGRRSDMHKWDVIPSTQTGAVERSVEPIFKHLTQYKK